MEVHSQFHKSSWYVQRQTRQTLVDSGRGLRDEGPVERRAIHTTHFTPLPVAWDREAGWGWRREGRGPGAEQNKDRTNKGQLKTLGSKWPPALCRQTERLK